MPRRRSVGLAFLALVVVAAAGGLAQERAHEQLQRYTRAMALTHGDPGAGRGALLRYGCGGCHRIPGLPGARGRVGPPLDGFADRLTIGGVLANTPDNLVRWLINPQAVDDRTAMPAVGADEAEARDMAAWLYARS